MPDNPHARAMMQRINEMRREVERRQEQDFEWTPRPWDIMAGNRPYRIKFEPTYEKGELTVKLVYEDMSSKKKVIVL